MVPLPCGGCLFIAGSTLLCRSLEAKAPPVTVDYSAGLFTRSSSENESGKDVHLSLDFFPKSTSHLGYTLAIDTKSELCTMSHTLIEY